jgi:hypothetical protein
VSDTPVCFVTLRDYVELHVRRLDDLRSVEVCRLDALRAAEQDRRNDLRSADRESIRTATTALDERLKGLNELRTGVATTAELIGVTEAMRRVERLVYIGMGLAIAASVAIPLLLR